MLYYKELYECDADENGGVITINYEIEEEDKDEVCEKLYDLFLNGETGTQCIMMYCHITGEDMEVVVEIEDYLDELIAMADADEDIKDDEDLQEWLKQLKQELQDTATLKYIQKQREGQNNV